MHNFGIVLYVDTVDSIEMMPVVVTFFQAKTSFSTYPSSAEIVSEPLGVVLVISTWNYPICMYCSLILFNDEQLDIGICSQTYC